MLSTLNGSALTRLQKSFAYDVVMRLLALAWSVFLALALAVELKRDWHAADPALPGAGVLNIPIRLSMIAYLVILAATVVVRMPPLGKARGAEPRVSAWLGSVLITVLVLFPRRELAPAAGCVSTLLVLVGASIAAVVLIQLRGSFSIMAEALQLTTSGAYRLVRHPLYLAEEASGIGAVMQFLSIWTVMLLVAQIVCQIRRMTNEEIVLMEVFPEYSNYKQKTFRIIPGLH
ncbi:MAG: isoprenylcysteine carboxylmethyltransferase family protein [Alphaproteobacteria bacterium]|nr:isoprenylcysteine carboxylmethyltransferase family protein [Alphaproteobacteria bacterium]